MTIPRSIRTRFQAFQLPVSIDFNSLFTRNLAISVFLIVAGGISLLAAKNWLTKPSPSVAGVSTSAAMQVAAPLATSQANGTIMLPLKNSSGVVLGELKYEVTGVERRDEILVKGQKATAVKGLDFLIINLKLTNSLNQGVDVNARDYIRLAVNGNQNEWLAPDIHNDPIEVQALSTKNTRVGFPINETDGEIILRLADNSDPESLPTLIEVKFE